MKRMAPWTAEMTADMIFLLDIGNTLLDGDRIVNDLRENLKSELGVMVADKLRILAAMNAIWGDRFTTVFARQGHYALDPHGVGAHPITDSRSSASANSPTWIFRRSTRIAPKRRGQPTEARDRQRICPSRILAPQRMSNATSSRSSLSCWLT